MQRAYGSRLERLVLFGSYARGEARPDSDIDVLVVLDAPQVRPLEEINRQSEIVSALGQKYDAVLSAIPFSLTQWRNPHHLLTQQVLSEGVALWKRN